LCKKKRGQFGIKWIKNGLHLQVHTYPISSALMGTPDVTHKLGWVWAKILCPNPSQTHYNLFRMSQTNKTLLYPLFFELKKISLKNLLVVIFKLNSITKNWSPTRLEFVASKNRKNLRDVDWPFLGMGITHFLTPKLWLGTFNQNCYALDFWSIFQILKNLLRQFTSIFLF
jgi:hypothetical protein